MRRQMVTTMYNNNYNRLASHKYKFKFTEKFKKKQISAIGELSAQGSSKEVRETQTSTIIIH